MLKDNNMQLSFYSILYWKIPENHTLKLLSDSVDFNFITDYLQDSYCKYHGRPAKQPELMVKLLVLQRLYDLSDRRVIEDASLNLAYMYFLGINPEDPLPHPSLLAKFRMNKLGDVTLDDFIKEIVKQCVDKGIIEDTGLTIDTTHSDANTFKMIPERVMKELAKKIFKTVCEETGEVPDCINQEIPDYKEIEDHKEAKKIMDSYLKETIEKVEVSIDTDKYPKTKEILEEAKEITNDPKFLEQKGVRSTVDQDARVGHKSKTDHFFGYKTEYMMTTGSKLITAVSVNNGAYVDGTDFEDLLTLTVETGLKIEDIFGDKAYFKKSILDAITGIEAKAYIPISAMAYKIDEELFSYNKDSDEWFCDQGNKTINKKYTKNQKGKEIYKYYFEKEKCRHCPLREKCIKKAGTVGRILTVGINTPEFYEYSQEQKTESFKEKYKQRACQEGKNGEMKNLHGLDRARGYGLKSMSRQAKLTAFAVNLKRIAKILSSLKGTTNEFTDIVLKIFVKTLDFKKTRYINSDLI